MSLANYDPNYDRMRWLQDEAMRQYPGSLNQALGLQQAAMGREAAQRAIPAPQPPHLNPILLLTTGEDA